MGLIAAGTSAPPADPSAVANNGFWPELVPATYRAGYRIDGTVTSARLVEALEAGRDEVNNQMSTAQAVWMATGIATAAAIPRQAHQVVGHHQTLYLRAVYTAAQALLVERYRDLAATQAGNDQADRKAPSIESYRRDARWAVCDLLGIRRTTVELI